MAISIQSSPTYLLFFVFRENGREIQQASKGHHSATMRKLQGSREASKSCSRKLLKLLKRDSRCKFYLMTKPHQTQNYSSSDSLLQLSHPNTKGHHSHPPHTPHFVLTLRSFFARQERWRGDTQGWPRWISATVLQHKQQRCNKPKLSSSSSYSSS